MFATALLLQSILWAISWQVISVVDNRRTIVLIWCCDKGCPLRDMSAILQMQFASFL